MKKQNSKVKKVVDKVDKKDIMQPKEQAVELWRTTHGHISNICSTIGVSRQTFYDWLNEDPAFNLAIRNAEAELNDDMREALIHKAGDGDTSAIKYYLDRRHPDFKPQPTTLVQVNNYDKAISADREKYQ